MRSFEVNDLSKVYGAILTESIRSFSENIRSLINYTIPRYISYSKLNFDKDRILEQIVYLQSKDRIVLSVQIGSTLTITFLLALRKRQK